MLAVAAANINAQRPGASRVLLCFTCALDVMTMQDVLAVAAATISAQRSGASREKLFTLRAELEALCTFANSVSHRVSKHVYQKLCEVAALF